MWHRWRSGCRQISKAGWIAASERLCTCIYQSSQTMWDYWAGFLNVHQKPRHSFLALNIFKPFPFVPTSRVLGRNVISLSHLNRARGICEWIESWEPRLLWSPREGFWAVTVARFRSNPAVFDFSLELGEGKVEDLKKFQARSSFRAGWSCQEEALKEKLLGGQQQAKNNQRTEAQSVHSRRLGKKKNKKKVLCALNTWGAARWRRLAVRERKKKKQAHAGFIRMWLFPMTGILTCD